MSIKQEPLEEILNNYKIKVLSIKNESYKEKKGVWWVDTPNGLKILKKISNSEDTLKFILSAIMHLSQNSINIPKVNMTSKGNEYVNFNKVCYILIDAIKGRNPSYSVHKELEKVIKSLALFHKASIGFFPLPETKPKKHLGTWVEDYSEQVEDMNRFYKGEDLTDKNNTIGKVIVSEFPYFYERAQNAIEALKGKEYSEWTEKVEKVGGLCHQDFAAGNLILNETGELYILDTDSITIDIPARDIRKLLNKVMKKLGKWDIELTKKILNFYQSENPLTPAEWKVIQLDLMFPHLFIGAINKYYYKRDKEWSTEKYLKRIKEMSAIEKSKSLLLDKFDSLIPR